MLLHPSLMDGPGDVHLGDQGWCKPNFKIIAYGITTLYMVGMLMCDNVKKQKKQVAEIRRLIADLEGIWSNLNML
jgi:hypothetical protein